MTMYQEQRRVIDELKLLTRQQVQDLSYKEVLGYASLLSDHGEQVEEIVPLLRHAYTRPTPQTVTLEVGSRLGGSALLNAYMLRDRQMGFLTVDISPATAFLLSSYLEPLCSAWNIPSWTHYERDSNVFCEEVNFQWRVQVLFHDGDHGKTSVMHDVLHLLPYLSSSGMIIVDDVQDWGRVPDLAKFGLKEYPTDNATHIRAWTKTNSVGG